MIKPAPSTQGDIESKYVLRGGPRATSRPSHHACANLYSPRRRVAQNYQSAGTISTLPFAPLEVPNSNFAGRRHNVTAGKIRAVERTKWRSHYLERVRDAVVKLNKFVSCSWTQCERHQCHSQRRCVPSRTLLIFFLFRNSFLIPTVTKLQAQIASRE